ncbi:MAG TPA: hypothetical protein VKT77_01225, partial [Chthonomonadaceae bacterium]|nr:hypothetical protein [Chthonomonadaceae bacterium]
STLHSFSGPDGAFPYARLLEGSNGLVYGTTTQGGFHLGTVFSLAVDTTPPSLTAAANVTSLWPPSGKSMPVVITGTISDSGSGVDLASGTYSTVDSYGLAQPSGTFAIGAGGSYSFTVSLEARRNGTDIAGRTYTVTVQGRDKAGNTAIATVVVTVPHDQR